MKCGKCNYWLIAPLVLLVAACGGKAKKQADGMTQEKETTVRESSTMETIQVGSVNVTWIQDNAGDRPMARSLFPDAGDALIDSLSLRDGVPSTVSVFVVKTDSVVILFDTGLGAADSRLQAGLKSLGMEPSDVRYLYLTHMHGDHIGGLLNGDSVVYARAEVFVPQVECQYWLSQSNGNGQLAARVVDAYGSRLHQFSFTDTTALPLGIRAMAAIGHTPGHSVYSVSGNRLLITGDLIHGYDLQCQDMNISPSYDINPEQAAHARKFFYSLASRKHSIIAGMHLPGNGVLIEVEPVQEMEMQAK